MTIQYDHDYKPGRLNLKGQQIGKQVIEARNAATIAWFEYEQSINEETGIGNSVLHDRAAKLQFEAERLSREWNRNYKD